MKKQICSFLIKAPKRRAHQALFDNDLPFRGRLEKTIKEYKRNSKHRNRKEE